MYGFFFYISFGLIFVLFFTFLLHMLYNIEQEKYTVYYISKRDNNAKEFREG